MEFEMRAMEDIEIGTDITPPLSPLSFSLHSHSSALHSDLRTALHLLRHHRPDKSGRIAGLLSNRHKLACHNPHQNEGDDEVSERIRVDAEAMAVEIAQERDDLAPYDVVLEEATVALCVVLTNAVEVQDEEGCALGVAVFGPTFSWINHSCSPNACYRFIHPSSPPSSSKLRIAPFVRGSQDSVIDNGICCSNTVFAREEGEPGYGPRLIVRSIKRIQKGEEVTVAYTDLLQPKEVRQLDLWSKYRFICCCNRCSVLPFAYVDHALQEISVFSHDSSGSYSNYKVFRDMADRRLTEYVDGVISEYLAVGDPESCCEKLEKILMQGLNEQIQGMEGKLHSKFMLYPLHYLSLNAYTTLASAYKVRASDFLSVPSEIDRQQLEAFDMRRNSAAYSLLLAGAGHHLFNYESSLIGSVANFWIGAGESLLSLVRSSAWSEFFALDAVASNLSSVIKFKCSKCSLIDRIKSSISNSQVRSDEFDNVSSEFLHCASDITQKVWSFLVDCCHLLKSCKDPMDFSWLISTKNCTIVDVGANFNKTSMCYSHESDSKIHICEKQCYTHHARAHAFQLSVHCLAYGGFLASICYGRNSHLPCHVKNILGQEESFV